MKRTKVLTTVLLCSVVVLVVLPVQVSAQQSRGSGRGMYGDWVVSMQFGENTFESILTFGRDSEGNRTGQWISFWGISELKDVQIEEGKLTFEHVRTNREGESVTSKFAGTIEEGKLSGTLTSDMGETELEGKRAPRIPRAVGRWEMKFKIGEREITTKLIVTTGEEGEIKGEWESQWGEHEITEIDYERGKLTFKRKSKFEDRDWESSFEGDVRGDTLTGKIKSEWGEVDVEGTRVNGDVIGTWNLDISSEQGSGKQRLKVNPDMSGMYGSTAIKKVILEDDKLSFKIVLEFGENKFEMDFAGKIEEGKVTGELKTSRGTSKVTGTKVVRTYRRRSTN